MIGAPSQLHVIQLDGRVLGSDETPVEDVKPEKRRVTRASNVNFDERVRAHLQHLQERNRARAKDAQRVDVKSRKAKPKPDPEPRSRGVWEEGTVELLGSDGEVYAIRPDRSSPRDLNRVVLLSDAVADPTEVEGTEETSTAEVPAEVDEALRMSLSATQMELREMLQSCKETARPETPGADEIASRIKGLPDDWRKALLKLLEDAEVQVALSC